LLLHGNSLILLNRQLVLRQLRLTQDRLTNLLRLCRFRLSPARLGIFLLLQE
jgi:hypothetical protein